MGGLDLCFGRWDTPQHVIIDDPSMDPDGSTIWPGKDYSNPRVLDFDNKRNYFNQQLHRRPHTREHYGTLQLNVRRQRVFEDSFQYLQRKTGDQIKYGKLSVRFYDEEGVDAGGVTREWFQILARQMFDPNYALFQPCAADLLLRGG